MSLIRSVSFFLVLALLALNTIGCKKSTAGKSNERTIVIAAHSAKIFPKEIPLRKKGDAANLAIPLLAKKWEIPLGPNRVTRTHYQGGYVFFTTDTNLLYMVDEKTGKIMWVRPFKMQVTFPVGISGDRLYYVAGDVIHDLDLTSGILLNKRTFDKVPANGIAVNDEIAVLTSESGNIVAHRIKPVSGKEWFNPRATWEMKSLAYLVGPIALVKDSVYYTNERGDVERISALTGPKDRAFYNVKNSKSFHAPIVRGKNVYVYCDNNTFYEIGRFSLLPQWSYPTPTPSQYKPVISDSCIALPIIGGIHCLDKFGKKLFESKKITRPLISTKHHLVGLKEKTLVALKLDDGKVSWKQPVVQGQVYFPTEENSLIIIPETYNSVAYYTFQ